MTRWRAMGIDAPLFMGRSDGALAAELDVGDGYVVPRQPRLGSGWWETFWMILTLPRQVRRIDPDLLFCAGNTYTIVAVALKLILGADCPPILAKISNDLDRRDLPAPARFFWRVWLRIQARFIDRWVVMDKGIVPSVHRNLGRVKLSVVPDPAIDSLPTYRGERTRDRGTRYVSVGRLVHQKNHALMLDAFAEVAGPYDVLTIMGDGPLRARLEAQAERVGIADRVVFAGHVPNAAEALVRHDVLLLSSRYEGVPAVLIEALARGMKIVSTDSGPGVVSLLGNGRLGQIVAPGDVDAFAAAIARAPQRPVDVAAARDRARSFTLDRVVIDYLHAFAAASDQSFPPSDAAFNETLGQAA